MKRPTFKKMRAQALKNPAVRAEYDALESIFSVKRKLIALRKQAGFTQEEMAQKLGTKRGNISRLESLTSAHLPRIDTVEQYARELGYGLEMAFVPLPKSGARPYL